MAGSDINPLFNIGPRIAGQILGLPYVQYRATSPTNPTDPSYQIATIPVWVTADMKGNGSTPFLPTKPISYCMTDPDMISVGDYIIGKFGTFFIASIDGVMPTQCVRCNKILSISRPGASNPSAGQYYGGVSATNFVPLMTGFPAAIVQGTKGERGEAALPGDVRQAWVTIMLPLAMSAPDGGGIRHPVQILPGDVITTTDATPLQYTISGCELTASGWRISAATAVG